MEKFKEKSSEGAKHDRWLSPEKESTEKESFIWSSLTFSGPSWLEQKYLKNSGNQIWYPWFLPSKISGAIYEVK